MDKPLKYFIGVTTIFAFCIGTFLVATIMDKPPALNEFKVVDENTRYMVAAKKRATATLDTLYNLYPQHTDSTFIRFSFEPTKGHVEHLWGAVLALDSAEVHVKLERKEGLEDVYYPDKLELPINRIEDWMVYPANGKVRGGYTVQALLMHDSENPAANKDSIGMELGKFGDRLE